jgi:hypothetical protein
MGTALALRGFCRLLFLRKEMHCKSFGNLSHLIKRKATNLHQCPRVPGAAEKCLGRKDEKQAVVR